MASLHFCVRDQDHPTEKKALEYLLIRSGMAPGGNLGACDVVAVHKRSDSLEVQEIDSVLRRDGIYIEYSTGGPSWEIVRERHFYGSYAELLNRLAPLRGKEDTHIADIVAVLGMATAEVQEECMAALAILCQGYLAVHGMSGNTQEEMAPSVRAGLEQMGCCRTGGEQGAFSVETMQSLGQHKMEVSLAQWWIDGIGIQSEESSDRTDELRQRLEREWTRGRQGGRLPSNLDQLLERIRDNNIQPPETVAGAYCALVERLGGRLCDLA